MPLPQGTPSGSEHPSQGSALKGIAPAVITGAILRQAVLDGAEVVIDRGFVLPVLLWMST